MSSITNDLVINELVNYLDDKASNALEEIILYGSRARGDFREHSDYDFLIVYKDLEDIDRIQDIVLDAEVLVMDRYEKLASRLKLSIWSKVSKFLKVERTQLYLKSAS